MNDIRNQLEVDSLSPLEGRIGEEFPLPFSESELDDDELLKTALKFLERSKSLHDTIAKKAKRNMDYYLGEQWDLRRLKPGDEPTVVNKIFQSLETIVPRCTSALPAPQVLLPDESSDEGKVIDNRVYEKNLEEVMFAIAEDVKLVQEMKDFLRDTQLSYLGVLKFGWDEESGRIWVKKVQPERMLVLPDQSYAIVGEYKDDLVIDLLRQFPDKKKEIASAVVGKEVKAVTKKLKNRIGGTRVGYYEFTTPYVKWWQYKDVVLHKVPNPHYDFSSKKKNFWVAPKIDYIFSDIWTFGLTPYSTTTLIEQILSLQDNINKRKQQIGRSARAGNDVVVGFGSMQVSKTEIAAINNARQRGDAAVFLENGEPGSFYSFKGSQLSPHVTEDMIHSIAEVDNIAGTHSTTRGEKTPGEITFGGQRLLREADADRFAELTEMLERVTEQLYQAFAQLIKYHFTKEDWLPYLGTDGTSKMIKIEKNLVKDKIVIKVRQGSALVKDKSIQAQEAILLWQNKAIDPVSLYERLGDPNPYKMAERLFEWEQQPERLFRRVSEEIKQSTQSEAEMKVVKSVMEAGIENQALVAGEAVPPNPNPTHQHIVIHRDLLESEDFMRLMEGNPEIMENFKTHVQAELEILQKNLEENGPGPEINPAGMQPPPQPEQPPQAPPMEQPMEQMMPPMDGMLNNMPAPMPETMGGIDPTDIDQMMIDEQGNPLM